MNTDRNEVNIEKELALKNSALGADVELKDAGKRHSSSLFLGPNQPASDKTSDMSA